MLGRGAAEVSSLGRDGRHSGSLRVSNPAARIAGSACGLSLGARDAAAARRIESAVALALEAGDARTRDVGGSASTTEATRAILRRLA